MSATSGNVKKRPVRGGVWGLIAGIGLALLLIAYNVIALGTLTPYLVIALMVVVGVAWGSLGPAKDRGDRAPDGARSEGDEGPGDEGPGDEGPGDEGDEGDQADV